MDIRLATAEDIPAIRAIARWSWDADPRIDRETIGAALREWYDTGKIEDELADTAAAFLLAEIDANGLPVGFAHVRWRSDGPEGTILRMYVQPRYRGRGIGTALFSEAERLLRRRGVTRIRATVLAHNATGNLFFEDLGFSLIGGGTTRIGDEWLPENTYVLDLAPLSPASNVSGRSSRSGQPRATPAPPEEGPSIQVQQHTRR